jgi:hypothetical protein
MQLGTDLGHQLQETVASGGQLDGDLRHLISKTIGEAKRMRPLTAF